MEQFSRINSKEENNTKILKTELYTLLAPYFSTEKSSTTDTSEDDAQPLRLNYIFSIDSKLIRLADTVASNAIRTINKHPCTITADIKEKGVLLFHTLMKQLDNIKRGISEKEIPFGTICTTDDLLEQCVTPELCQYLSYTSLVDIFKEYDKADFKEEHKQKLKEIYMHQCGFSDENTFEIAEEYKLSEIPHELPKGMTMDSQYTYTRKLVEREHLERKEEERQRQKEKCKKDDEKILKELQKRTLKKENKTA
ncbi:MAG: hypothetical protein IJ660_00520 [Alphaproteobacteria bacterium]|nr:hypothetical protein [Alphaproteobacteria bacterium]